MSGGRGPTAEAPRGTPEVLDRLLQDSSRTFALTIPLLPEPTRCAVTVAYLLFRVADTLEDATRWSRDRKIEELETLERFLAEPGETAARAAATRWLEDPPHDHAGYLELLAEFPRVIEALEPLAATTRERVLRHTKRTIAGMVAFVRRERDGRLELDDVEDLKRYCYAVAGIVGEMLTELFVEGDSRLQSEAPALRRDAAAFGEALQLVNILKDSASDSREGRQYLPSGVERSEVFDLAYRDLAIAAGYCTRLEQAGAERGVVAFTALPVLLAHGTLDRVRRDGPGAKLGRPEVLAIIERLHDALDARNVAELVRPLSSPGEGSGT